MASRLRWFEWILIYLLSTASVGVALAMGPGSSDNHNAPAAWFVLGAFWGWAFRTKLPPVDSAPRGRP